MPDSPIFEKAFPVRGACFTRISFDVDLPPGAELFIQHLDNGVILAHEYRSVPVDARSLEIKTHPGASHIACAFRAGERDVEGARFTVDCGDAIEPVGRHFIVIGAMKAGTTTLFRALESHPAICRTWAEGPGPSFAKEINYFRRLYRIGDTPLHYDWRFPYDASRHAWTLDVSPNYAKLPGSREVPSRIASLGSKIKIAYILREPTDRVESHIAHALREGKQFRNLRHAIRLSCYSSHLDNFSAHISMEDILLLDFEKLRRDPASLIAEVCHFLGIDPITTGIRAYNKRSVRFRLNATQREEVAKAVRNDAQRLIDVYGFKAAESWFKDPALPWLRRLRFLE